VGRLFPEFLQEFKEDPDSADAYDRALRIHQLFEQVPVWTEEQVVPEDSLLREFIGGSVYKY